MKRTILPILVVLLSLSAASAAEVLTPTTNHVYRVRCTECLTVQTNHPTRVHCGFNSFEGPDQRREYEILFACPHCGREFEVSHEVHTPKPVPELLWIAKPATNALTRKRLVSPKAR